MSMHGIGICACASVGVGIVGVVVSAQPGTTEPETPRDIQSMELVATQREREIEAVRARVAELYEVVSGPAGERDWERFQQLFGDGAILTQIYHTEQETGVLRVTPEQFARRSGPILMERSFYEREIASQVQLFGGLAHVWSVYESLNDPEGEPFSRGINSIQLVRGGDGVWRILSVAWDAEGQDRRIPREYLGGADASVSAP